MQIAVGSHRAGFVPASEAERLARENYPSGEARRGDVLILKMLTLHASKPSTVATSRRPFRVDYASGRLPEPLRWAEA